MYNSRPFFVRFTRYGNQMSRMAGGTGGWLLVAPGLLLVLLGLAILIWPELLAYMIAGLLLMIGATLAGWGWRAAQARKRMVQRSRNGVYYHE